MVFATTAYSAEEKKAEKLRFALDNDILDQHDISYKEYIKHSMWKELRDAAKPISISSSKFVKHPLIKSKNNYFIIKSMYKDRYLILEDKRNHVILDLDTKASHTYYIGKNREYIPPIIYNGTFVEIHDEYLLFRSLPDFNIVSKLKLPKKVSTYRAVPRVDGKLLEIYNLKYSVFQYWDSIRALHQINLETRQHIKTLNYKQTVKLKKKKLKLSLRDIEKQPYIPILKYGRNKKINTIEGNKGYELRTTGKGVEILYNNGILSTITYPNMNYSGKRFLYTKSRDELLITSGGVLTQIDVKGLFDAATVMVKNKKKRRVFMKEFSDFAYSGKYNNKTYAVLSQINQLNINTIQTAYSKHVLSTYNMRIRKTIKHGKIGERYVPYTTSSSTSYSNDHMMINGEALYYSTPKKRSSSSGGYEEDVWGYQAVYEVKNQSKNYYLVEMSSTWTGSHSKWATKSHGSWSDKSGTYNTKVSQSNKAKYPQTFVLAPGEKIKYQFELGEKEPKDLATIPVNVQNIDKAFYKGLLLALSPENKRIPLIDKYLSDDMVVEWHKSLKDQKQRIIQEKEDKYNKKNIRHAKIRLEYDKDDYDKEFVNTVFVVIRSKKPIKVKFETPFKTDIVSVKNKKGWRKYEHRSKHSVKDISKEDLLAKVVYVWPIE